MIDCYIVYVIIFIPVWCTDFLDFGGLNEMNEN